MFYNEGNPEISISEFFKGKSILITGGSGFIGKVLIEKLLRSCSDLENIYMLLRPKKNRSLEERIKILTDTPLFDKLREKDANFLDKIILVDGDVKQPKLGISEENRKRIIDNVSIIYHSAASVRFDDPIKDAVLTNVRSTREIMNLAQELKNIDAVVHVSTLYANADNEVIEEKLYPRHDWQDLISLVENCDDRVLEVLTEKYIHPLPNTYTFTKSVAESVIDDYCKNNIPAVILRPSIVIPTRCDPVVGWIDNFNGPTGLIVAGAKGILGTLYCDPNIKLDYVFADNVVKAMIVATWKTSLDFRKQKKEIMICNVSSDILHCIKFYDESHEIIHRNPLQSYIGTSYCKLTKCWYIYFLRLLALHILPSLLIDGVLVASGRKFRLLTIFRRVFIANMATLRFIMNEWKSMNNNYLALDDAVSGSDRTNFSFHRTDERTWLGVILEEFFRSGKMYLLKEKPRATEFEVKRYRIFVMAVKIFQYAVLGFILYHVMWRFRLRSKAYEMFYNYFANLDS